MVFIRFTRLISSQVRLAVAFATIGVVISWSEVAVFVIAPTLGSAVAIVPAGLGVSEMIAAGLASVIAISSASAFLAVTLDRVMGLAAGAFLVAVISVLVLFRKDSSDL